VFSSSFLQVGDFQQALGQLPPNVASAIHVAKTDVTSEDSVQAALDLAEKNFGGSVNVAVNCAGLLNVNSIDIRSTLLKPS